MGGLVAVCLETGQVEPGALERATRSLDHRGSDDRQHWIGDVAQNVEDMVYPHRPISNRRSCEQEGPGKSWMETS